MGNNSLNIYLFSRKNPQQENQTNYGSKNNNYSSYNSNYNDFSMKNNVFDNRTFSNDNKNAEITLTPFENGVAENLENFVKNKFSKNFFFKPFFLLAFLFVDFINFRLFQCSLDGFI